MIDKFFFPFNILNTRKWFHIIFLLYTDSMHVIQFKWESPRFYCLNYRTVHWYIKWQCMLLPLLIHNFKKCNVKTSTCSMDVMYSHVPADQSQFAYLIYSSRPAFITRKTPTLPDKYRETFLFLAQNVAFYIYDLQRFVFSLHGQGYCTSNLKKRRQRRCTDLLI